MTLTLLALFLIPVLLKMVLDPEGMHKILKQWSGNEALQFASTLVPFLLVLMIFTTSKTSFKLDWESLLSWIGVLIFLRAVINLFPSTVRWQMKIATVERIPIFGFLGLLVALGFIYVDTQLL